MKKKSILLVLLSLMCVSCSSSLSLNSKKNIVATPVVKEESTQGSEENLSQTVKVKVHYARNDAKSIKAGALKYLNFINIVLKKK